MNSGGGTVAARAIEKLGSRLVEGQLRGMIRRQLAPCGVTCAIEIPLGGRVTATAQRD